MKLSSYLHLSRHNIYYFRRRISDDVRHFFNTNEIRQSLATSNLKVAIARARILANDSENLFFKLKNNMTTDDLEHKFKQLIQSKQKEIRLFQKVEDLEHERITLNKRHKIELDLKELDTLRSLALSPSVLSHKKPIAAPFLSELIQDFLSVGEVKRRGDKPATVRKDRDALSLFIGVTNDKPINEVTQSDAALFSKEVLTYKRKGTVRSVNTVNNHMSSVSKFSNYIIGIHSQEGHTKLDFTSLRYKKIKSASAEREMFEVSEIKLILSHDKFLKARVSDTEKYWLICIALFSGMRLEEITQLDPKDDIYEDAAGILVFDINSRNGKSLKNNSSQRLIPVHSQLISMGLVAYIEKIKTKSSRLFPNSTIRDGRTGKNLGKKANYFINNIVGIKGKTLHSFRHTFATMLKRAKVDESIAAEILGHAHGGISYKRYGKNHVTEVLKDEMESHIKYDV